jgi:hypothetical protein
VSHGRAHIQARNQKEHSGLRDRNNISAAAAVLVAGLVVIGLMAVAGCGHQPEVQGNYLSPEGGTLVIKAGGKMSLKKLPGTSTINGTYKVKGDELSLYGPDSKSDKPLMTFRVDEDKVVELIDVTGLIWLKQPQE